MSSPMPVYNPQVVSPVHYGLEGGANFLFEYIKESKPEDKSMFFHVAHSIGTVISYAVFFIAQLVGNAASHMFGSIKRENDQEQQEVKVTETPQEAGKGLFHFLFGSSE